MPEGNYLDQFQSRTKGTATLRRKKGGGESKGRKDCKQLNKARETYNPLYFICLNKVSGLPNQEENR